MILEHFEDTTQTACLAYQTFENFKRPCQMLMKDHLVKYEQLHTKIKDHQMILLDIPLGITEIYYDKKSLTEAAHSTSRRRKTVEGRLGSNQAKRLKKRI